MPDIFSVQIADFSTSVPHKVTITGCNNFTSGIVSGFEFSYSPIGATREGEWPDDHIIFNLNDGHFTLIGTPPRGVINLIKIVTKREIPFDSCSTNGCSITLTPFVGCLTLDNSGNPDENAIKYKPLKLDKAFLISYALLARQGLYLVANAQFIFFELAEV
jgi:hypothetical protein